jgi:hypothetical protein
MRSIAVEIIVCLRPMTLRGHGDRAELPVALRAIDRRIIAEGELPGLDEGQKCSIPAYRGLTVPHQIHRNV